MNSFNLSEYLANREKDYNPAWVIDKKSPQHYAALTPNKVEVDFSTETDFAYLPEVQYQSTMLWYHSLSWLKVIAKKYRDFEFIDSVISSYHDFMFSEKAEEIYETLTSRDHLAAEQVRSITYLFATEKIKNIEQCKEILEYILAWGLVPENVKDNNHGMMLVASLLHIPLFINVDEDKKLEGYATQKLIDIISNAFDSTGLCKENSPIYHKFYITYITQLIAEINIVPQSDTKLLDFLQETKQKAESTLQEISLPNGSLPPFGDGNATDAVVEPTTRNSSFFSEESGFFCSKTATANPKYFAVKCGYSSITHKHSDDTSVYFWYNGQPIIMDAGFFNYDWQDPRTLIVKSQKGHSGAFFEKFDDLYPGALFPLNRPLRVESALKLEYEGNLHKLTASSTIDKDFSVKREIRFSHLNNILIKDEFQQPTPEVSPKITRYLINGELGIRAEDEKIVISGSGFEMDVVIKGGDFSITRGISENNSPIAGWSVKKQFDSLTPCWLLEITPKFNTVISNLILREENSSADATSNNTSAEATAIKQVTQYVKEINNLIS